MRFADFIVSNMELILRAWESFAHSIRPGATMESLALREHAEDILLTTARDMNSSQNRVERSAKSMGNQPEKYSVELDGASERHAIGRLGSGFNLMEIVSEYRALRASVLQLRKIARSQDGDIHVTSTQESGTTFTIRLPRHTVVTSARPILDETTPSNHVTAAPTGQASLGEDVMQRGRLIGYLLLLACYFFPAASVSRGCLRSWGEVSLYGGQDRIDC